MQAMILVIKILGYSKIKNTFNYFFLQNTDNQKVIH